VSPFKNENSFIYKKGILIVWCILLISIVLTKIFDHTIYEPIFKKIWYLTFILWSVLLGTKEVFVNRSKLGYFYFIGVIVFIFIFINAINN